MKKSKTTSTENFSTTKKTYLKRIGILIIIILVSLSLIPWVISNNVFSRKVDDNKWVVVGNKYAVSNIILGEYSSFVQKNYYYIQQQPYMLMQFLNNLISQYVSILLFANEAEHINLSVDKNLLLKLISEIPVFKNSDGTFNSDKFKSRVSTIFGSEEAFMENVTDNILKDQLLEPIMPLINQPFFISYIDLMALSQERTIRYIDLTPLVAKLPVANPTEKDLIKIRDENKSLFTVPEKRNGSLLTINVNDLIQKVSINDNELKEHYKKTKSSYLTQETRTISQVAFDTQEAAEKAFKDIKAGKKIDKKFTNIENINYGSLPEDFSKEIFNAKLNELHAPAQSPIGWHIFKVTKITPQKTKPFDEVKDLVKEDLLNQKKSSIVEEKRNEIISLLNQKLPFQQIATKTGATYQEFKDLSEENIDNSKISDEAYKHISTLASSQNSGLIDDSNGNLLVVNVTKITPSVVKTTAQAKKELLGIWKNNKMQEKSTELENKIIANLSSGKKISSLGYATKVFKGNMNSKDMPFTNETTEVTFTSDKNIPIAGTLKNQGKVVIVVENIKNKNISYENKGIRNQDVVNFAHYVSPSYIQSYFERYANILSKKYKIKVNQEAIMNKLAPKNNEQQ